jgi:hypothetical protein
VAALGAASPQFFHGSHPTSSSGPQRAGRENPEALVIPDAGARSQNLRNQRNTAGSGSSWRRWRSKTNAASSTRTVSTTRRKNGGGVRSAQLG